MSGINGDWYEALRGNLRNLNYKTLFNTVNEEYRTRQIFPPANDIFNAFHLTPLKDVKVVILGQDPYTISIRRTGCASRWKRECRCLRLWLIFIKSCRMIWLYHSEPRVSDKMGRAGSTDAQYGADGAGAWGKFPQRNRLGGIYRCSDHAVNAQDRPIVFILWGAPAQRKNGCWTIRSIWSLSAASESPVCIQRIFGSRPFSQTNQFLEEHGVTPIDWQIE